MDPALDLGAVRDFAIALAIGALVGVEREKHKIAEGNIGISGLRTFILFAMVGAMSAWLGRELGTAWVFVAAILATAGALTAGYILTAKREPSALGLTTEIAAVCVCLLGGMTMLGHPELAVVLGIATSAVLAYKKPLHGVVERLGPDDIFAALRLLIATFIVLPLLPDRPIDPWNALNPYSLWLLVILISSLSLVGYVAIRWLGPGKGTAVTGLAGGLVSSTAVTLSFARSSRAAEPPGREKLFGAGIVLAWGVMFPRVIVEVAVVNAELVGAVTVPFAAMGLASLAIAAAFYRSGLPATSNLTSATEEVPLRNPFSLRQAAKFALFFAAVLLVVKIVQNRFSSGGLYLVSALAGMTDVDAITLSMAQYAAQGGNSETAIKAIVLAAMSNTLVKGGLVATLGASALRYRILVATTLIVLAGAVFLLPLF